MSIDALGQYGHVIIQRVSEGMEAADLARCRLVCKLWKGALDDLCKDQGFWQRLSVREGISEVEGPGRNCYEDFKVLYPATISGRRICRSLESVTGIEVRLVGRFPRIKEEIFNLFVKSVDPYGKGKIQDNFVFIGIPSEIEITCGGETRLSLDEQGNLIKVPDQESKEKKREVSFSLSNFKMLCSQENAHTPIFHKSTKDDIIQQSGAVLPENRVYLIRKFIAEGTMGMPFEGPGGQEAFVKNRAKITNLIEFGVTSLLVRAVCDAVLMRESKTFYDEKNTRARCSDRVRSGVFDHYPVVGSYWPDSKGVYIYSTYREFSAAYIGVAPCVLAGVSETSVVKGVLAIEKEQ